MSRGWAGSGLARPAPASWRPHSPYSSAPSTRLVSARSAAFQPTTRLEKASRTLASHSGPSQVGIREMSATHSRLGAGAVKQRLTRSGAGVALGSWRVEQRHRLRRKAPCRPWARISRSTRLREVQTPSRRSWACTRGAP
jgi:hypothetical protein